MRRVSRFAAAAACVALALGACARTPDAPPTLFERLSPAQTGVTFENRLPESPTFNINSYLYYYNGGGVAVGDVNGDGRPDLYFTANLGRNRLYLNRGDYRFEDVTDRAGVADSGGWKTGVTMADVNGDGHLDIYVSGVDYAGVHGRDVLYVNDGAGTFTDRTAEYGLVHAGYSTHSLFFDYDGDGDLDAFIVTHLTATERAIGGAPAGDQRVPRSGGLLFRNDPAPNGPGRRFVDVTAQAGIVGREGYGLGAVASDFNGDGCPDLYVAVDFQGDDFLWINGCDGTFTNHIRTATGHTSRFSMGVDAADVNDDGRPDVMVGDMFPEREEILKTSASAEGYNLFNLRLRAGYHPQFARNTLQLNRGGLRFSEIGLLAGVDATDWSWAPLFADLDNDGRKDLFMTSGIFRRPNDLDYINYVGNDAVQAALARGDSQTNLAALRRMPQVEVPNHAFRNDGDLRFTNMADAWGLGQPGFSNGAAYVDLNGSGALDLVVSTVNGPAAIYRNRARERNGNAYLTVALAGDGANTGGVGAKVFVRSGGEGRTQMLEQQPTRGFESSVDQRLHFGLGRNATVESLTVVWPDRRFQTLANVAANRVLTLSQRDAAGRWTPPTPLPEPMRFADVTDGLGLEYRHAENSYSDLDREPLMPHLLSTEGPALAVGDVNGDGRDDVYAGGGKWQPGQLLMQLPNGTFRASPQPAIAADSLAEDVDAAFFDADGDGDQDLVVVGGGNEFAIGADPLRALQPRLYVNDGAGQLRRAADALPAIAVTAGCVVPGDFDGDGRIDLFIGGRVVAHAYGRTPQSYLLRNVGGGRFADVTASAAPALGTAGMVSAAAWTDYDGDGRRDLVVVGEWMPVRMFRQESGRLVDRTREAGLTGTEGWWTTVAATDVTGDGRPDLVLGNVGLNSYVRASAKAPARLYVNDFAHNGVLQQVLTFYKDSVSRPLAGRDELVRLISPLRSKYPSYASFGATRVEDIFPAADLAKATVLEARTFASSVAVNAGNGTFRLRPLPVEAQFAPVYATVAGDFDGDGTVDLLLGGNFHGLPPILGRHDASYGVALRGLGDGRFAAADMERSGLLIDGQVRDMKWLRRARGDSLVVVARNGDGLRMLRPMRGDRPVVAARPR